MSFRLFLTLLGGLLVCVLGLTWLIISIGRHAHEATGTQPKVFEAQPKKEYCLKGKTLLLVGHSFIYELSDDGKPVPCRK